MYVLNRFENSDSLVMNDSPDCIEFLVLDLFFDLLKTVFVSFQVDLILFLSNIQMYNVYIVAYLFQ